MTSTLPLSSDDDVPTIRPIYSPRTRSSLTKKKLSSASLQDDHFSKDKNCNMRKIQFGGFDNEVFSIANPTVSIIFFTSQYILIYCGVSRGRGELHSPPPPFEKSDQHYL